MNAIEVSDLVVRYGRVTALDGASVQVAPGEALGIVGPNGSGKSTLLKTIAGLLKPAMGSVCVLGKEPRALKPGSIAYVPQIEDVDWTFPVNVRDVVSMGRFPRLGLLRPFGAEDRRAVADALKALNISHLAGRHISELSGGQQQRAFVARAIAQNPKIMLLDEPTTGVDAATEEALRQVVRNLASRGITVVMTTHDLDRAADWFDRLMVLDRRVLATGAPQQVLESGAYAGIREHTHTHGHLRSNA